MIFIEPDSEVVIPKKSRLYLLFKLLYQDAKLITFLAIIRELSFS